MAKHPLKAWGNPVIALAVQRYGRSRGLAGWVLLTAALAGGTALGLAAWPAVAMPILRVLLLGRFSSPGPGEAFLIPLVVVGFLFLTLGLTIPQATLAITREREQRTLEPLLLTQLSPTAILSGELVQILLPPFLASVCLLPLMSLSFSLGGIAIGSIVAAFAVLLLCHLFVATASLCASNWCRRSTVAMVLGYLGLLLVIGVPLLVGVWQRGAGEPAGWQDALLALNPVAALESAVLPQAVVVLGPLAVPFALMAGMEYLLLSLLFFAVGVRGLRRG